MRRWQLLFTLLLLVVVRPVEVRVCRVAAGPAGYEHRAAERGHVLGRGGRKQHEGQRRGRQGVQDTVVGIARRPGVLIFRTNPRLSACCDASM